MTTISIISLKLLASWNSRKWAFIINTDYRKQRRIIDRQKRGILTSSNEQLCGAHYHILGSSKKCEEIFLQCGILRHYRRNTVPQR